MQVNEVSERIKDIYREAQKIDKEVFVEPIKTDNPVIYTVTEILQGISLSRTGLDVKGEGYEHFLGGVFRGAMGQYFTPRNVVRMCVKMFNPGQNEFVIDPACGSGAYLLGMMQELVELMTALYSAKLSHGPLFRGREGRGGPKAIEERLKHQLMPQPPQLPQELIGDDVDGGDAPLAVAAAGDGAADHEQFHGSTRFVRSP